MKKIILFLLLIIFLGCGLSNTCFASVNETITFSCYTTTNLTKTITFEATGNISINWGDGNTFSKTESNSDERFYTHEYVPGTYQITITATDIKTLSISDSDIFQIDLSKATLLKELDLSNNKLQTLSLTSNTALEKLLVSNNILTSLNVSSTKLTSLDCSNNQISSMSLPNTIVELNCSGNELSTFSFSGLTLLKKLECQDNSISSLGLTNFGQLEYLNCSNNFLTSLSTASNTKLKELYCYGNELQTLNTSSNTLLQVLNCVGNKITSLALSSNSNLKELYILRNNITSINLYNISLTRVVLDNTVSISNSSSSTLIKVGITGSGSAELNSNRVLLFSKKPQQLLINSVAQSNLGMYIDITGYTGTVNILITFAAEDLENIEDVNSPQLLSGMIPLKHNGTNWVITNPEDREWYNYSKTGQKWANVMLRDDAYYLDVDGVTLKAVGSTELDLMIGREVLDNYTGSMYVWIPRFTYQISGNQINIKYSKGLSDDVLDGYKIHPAFNYLNYLGGDASNANNYLNFSSEDKKLGMWVAKYPAGKSISSPKYSSSATRVVNANISDAFLASKLTATSSTYGINSSEATSHMMKNTEWGAIAYFTTSVGNLSNNSTTGNVYGIFDMESNLEYVSSFIELVGGVSNYSVRKNGKNLLPYKIVSYSNYELANPKDIEMIKIKSAYDNATSNKNVLLTFDGIGIKEVNENITGVITNQVPYGSNPFLVRGIDGIYSYSSVDGSTSNGVGFRNILFGKDSSSGTSQGSTTETFIIESDTDENGIISPEGKTVIRKGKNITYLIKVKEGYELVDVIVDGISVYNNLVKYTSPSTYYTYTFTNVISNHEISVITDTKVFPYQVTVVQNPTGTGTIDGVDSQTGKATYNSRAIVELGAIGKRGYQFVNWEVDSGLDAITDPEEKVISFKMPSNNVTLIANFIPVPTATVTVENIYGGMIVDKYVGTLVTIQAKDSSEYKFTSWTATGITLDATQKVSPEIKIKIPNNAVKLVANYTLK